MKIIVQILGYIFFPVLLFAQLPSLEASLSMSWEQNQQWLLTLKTQEKPLQWKMITARYFKNRTIRTDETPSLYTPLLIINGLLMSITESTSEDTKNKLLTLLTEDKIDEIMIIEKQPEDLYIEKPFTGFILISVNDKKTSRTLKKIKTD
jgi:hypothetical protein